MLLKLEKAVPYAFQIQIADVSYLVEMMDVSYRTQYDFVFHASRLETEIEIILEAWNEQIIELDICLMNNITDSPKMHLTYYRLRATVTYK